MKVWQRILLAGVIALLIPEDAKAQRWPLSFEPSGGRAWASYRGEEYRYNGNVAGDLLLAYAFGRAEKGRPVLAISHGFQSPWATDLLCILKPDGSCVPSFPTITMTGLLFGYESGTGNLRVVAGPTDIYLGNSSLAWQARANVFMPLISHMSVGLTARAAHLPRYQGRSFNLLSTGLVVRIR